MSKKPKKKDSEQETKNEEQEDAEFLLSATRAPGQGAQERFHAIFRDSSSNEKYEDSSLIPTKTTIPLAHPI